MITSFITSHLFSKNSALFFLSCISFATFHPAFATATPQKIAKKRKKKRKNQNVYHATLKEFTKPTLTPSTSMLRFRQKKRLTFFPEFHLTLQNEPHLNSNEEIKNIFIDTNHWLDYLLQFFHDHNLDKRKHNKIVIEQSITMNTYEFIEKKIQLNIHPTLLTPGYIRLNENKNQPIPQNITMIISRYTANILHPKSFTIHFLKASIKSQGTHNQDEIYDLIRIQNPTTSINLISNIEESYTEDVVHNALHGIMYHTIKKPIPLLRCHARETGWSFLDFPVEKQPDDTYNVNITDHKGGSQYPVTMTYGSNTSLIQ